MPKKSEVDDLEARARAVATRLNAASDLLNESLGRAQNALVDMGLGVWATVSLWEAEDGDQYESLSFGKHEGRWGLLLEAGFNSDPWSTQYTPILETSREDRQRAARSLPALFAALIEAAERAVGDVEQSRTAVDHVAAAAAKARR